MQQPITEQFRLGQKFPINGQLYELRRICKDGKRLVLIKGLGVPNYSFVVMEAATGNFWQYKMRCAGRAAMGNLIDYLEKRSVTCAPMGQVEGVGNDVSSKLLQPGARVLQDLEEAKQSIERAIEIERLKAQGLYAHGVAPPMPAPDAPAWIPEK